MKLLITTILILFITIANAQLKLYSKSAGIHFFSHTAFENVEARNNKAVSIWIPSTGQIEFSVLMKGFEFEKALMQEHFNENYIESDKYPKAIFKGIIDKSSSISFTKDSTYKLTVKGNLTLHGVTKQITVPAIIKVKNGIASATSDFSLPAEDYNIKIPAIVADKINKKISVNIMVTAYQVLSNN